MEGCELQKAVGARAKELRQKSGRSQETFASDAGLDRTYIASVEAGHRNITIQSLYKICEALNISLGNFFDTDSFSNPEEKK